MALPLKYNLRNIIVRKGSTLATAFTIGLTVAVFLLVMALARGIDLTLASSGEPLNMIVLREGSTAELNSSITREQFNDLMYLDGIERENDKPLATGEAFESEIWVDINSLASTTKRETFSSALFRVKDQNALSALTKRVTDDPKLHLKALSERAFYEDQQGTASGALKGLAVFISFIMAVGAGFAGMNTMYAAVARRTKEIGTLR